MEEEFGGYHRSLCSGRSCTDYSKKNSSRSFRAHAISLTLLVELAQEGMEIFYSILQRLIDLDCQPYRDNALPATNVN